MDPTLTDTIDMHGDPLAFLARRGSGAPLRSGRDVIKVEARQMAEHQKEAVATEGADGSAWRLTSDEGLHLKGTDLAPFPLGFFNAGLQADLYGRIRTLAAQRGIALDAVAIRVVNHYWLTGSFIHGTGEGHAEAPDIEVEVQSPASADAIEALVAAAMDASPAIAFLRAPLAGNTFALYINGRRRPVEGIANSPTPDAGDPYRVYARAPRPLDPKARRDLIEKTGRVEQGEPQLAAPTVTNKLIRNIFGDGKPHRRRRTVRGRHLPRHAGREPLQARERRGRDRRRALRPDPALGRHRVLLHDPALALHREHEDEHPRRAAGAVQSVSSPEPKAVAEPIDTHLFLNGEAPEETHLQLLTIAARTCYLHAAAKTPVEPNLRIVHNGRALARAA